VIDCGRMKYSKLFSRLRSLGWVIAILLGVTACERKGGGVPSGVASASVEVRARRSAPDFELKDKAGKTHRLRDFAGKAVLVHFWASWCPPCLEELPQFLELVRTYEGKPVVFVAISLDRSWEEAEKMFSSARVPANLVKLLDSEQKVSDAFGSFQFPETYWIGADGKIQQKWVGAQNWSSPELRARLTPEQSGS
jgi:cytochrome c biogenesis protein CcmG/thiol:disulfide interchange protein DsbE